MNHTRAHQLPQLLVNGVHEIGQFDKNIVSLLIDHFFLLALFPVVSKRLADTHVTPELTGISKETVVLLCLPDSLLQHISFLVSMHAQRYY